jgi:hypothetical protein
MALVYKAKGSRIKFSTIYAASLAKLWQTAGLPLKHKNSVAIPFDTDGSECQEATTALANLTHEQLKQLYDECVESKLWNPNCGYEDFEKLRTDFVDFLTKCKNGYEA